ncbi:sporulation protein YtaF [Syntrophobotulus glycolicus DSM 8271]|uniref:Sporulation protein YtaF n=1 Tax=Syntrophobotulus glycolicus (strain DSM 8271 / FlGlyR) TaxID=645991 RepID=F0T2Q5_SYNGF|nr:sporulation membrane protein YtaF [Syntrophobotulus glycolicus]ADY56454.1 sporulation protein YtaF [Syntrophobotulus glycolicus DSM 8271]
MGVTLLVAFALSLDGFGVGMAYGLKNIRIPFRSMCIIGLCTVATMGISMFFGYLLIPYLDMVSPKVLGAAVLIMIGCFQLIKALSPTKNDALNKEKAKEEAVPVFASYSARVEDEETRQLFRLNLSIFGLVIQILKTPSAADIDNSGTIGILESFLLGLALSLDAFSSGIAASMAGIPAYSIVLVALTQFIMIRTGHSLVGKLSSKLLERAKFLPGVLLILVGSIKMF